MIALYYLSHTEEIQAHRPLSTFPKQIGEWVGKEERFDQNIYAVLGVDDSYLATYTPTTGRKVNFYVGFYETQREGDLIHSPKLCIPGGGWNITHTQHEKLLIPGTNPGNIKVNRLIIEKANQKQIVLYWFQSRGRFVASEYMQKIYLLIDSILTHRTDGAFVRLMAPVINGDEKKALSDLRSFAGLLLPILQEFIPS
jgi:EpsI family protein